MHRFSNILVYVDPRPESIEALKTAACLARQSGARVTAMDVVPDVAPPRFWSSAGTEPSEAAVGGRLADLQATVDPFRAEVPIDVCVVSRGRISLELLRQAVRERHDLVIKTARGTDRGRRVFFGTTAMHLIRKCPCPVWLVSPEPLRDPPRILAAVNPQSGGDGQLIAAKVLDRARALTRHVGGELHVAHAWHPAAAGLLRRHVSTQELRRYIEDVEQKARSGFDALLAGEPESVARETHHLLRETPDEAIPELASKERIDTIVMGSVGRTGIAGLLIGEMAEEILGRVQCGVFCVKPDGFVSPIVSESEGSRLSA